VIAFRPDPTIWDGRFANNPWLQELPKPLYVLTWDNAALVSPATARQLGLISGNKTINDYETAGGQMLEITHQGRTLKAAAWIVPGHPDGSITLTLGYGRTQAGRVGTGTGFNAYALRTSDQPWFGVDVQARKVAGRYKLASTQHHFSLEGRDIVRAGTLEELRANPANPPFTESHFNHGPLPSLYPQEWPSDRRGFEGGHGAAAGGHAPEEHAGGEQAAAGHATPGAAAGGVVGAKPAPIWESKHGDKPIRTYNDLPVPAWAMVIDMNACIGCNACTIACQAENNIATVGKDQVANNREMHWIRIDTYYEGDPANPNETVFQPMTCQHCEKAPCEPVCPVEATSHSVEGINEMTYNRCIGTRYCANNCPYKVRRFNYLQYSDMKTPTLQMMRNPDVTVRARGVMEKCTYCIQRIQQGRIEAEKEERPIRDGDVVTACQQVCPTQAIVFGDANDRRSNGGKGSKVRQLQTASVNFTVLTELGTQPRTSYLATMRNPNPALEPAAAAPAAGTEGHG
jgi:molybdopterin-containing oxidoreductase family iron-sulfur binding subunit